MNWVADRDLEMRFAQPFLEAMSVIAPLAGLLGTVVGFSRFLSSMGPKMNVPATDNLGGVGDVLINTAMGLAISLVATVTLHLNNGFRNWQLDVWARDVRRQLTSTAQS